MTVSHAAQQNGYVNHASTRRTAVRMRIRRQYRRLVLILLTAVILLIVLLFLTKGTHKVEADEYLVETYETIQIQPGDTLWDLADQHKLSTMSTNKYISQVKTINGLSDDRLVSGQYLILPVFSDQPSD